jgi:hypothetical protein
LRRAVEELFLTVPLPELPDAEVSPPRVALVAFSEEFPDAEERRIWLL